MFCPNYTEIEYIKAEIDKLDFRDSIDEKYKSNIRDELLKDGLYLDYVTTDRKITNTEGLKRASDEELINAKRMVILKDIIF